MTAPQSRQFGAPVPDFRPPQRPDGAPLIGRYVQLDRLCVADHGRDLHSANARDDRIWDYLPYGPFADAPAYHEWVAEVAEVADPFFYAITPFATGKSAGVASFLRIKPEAGSIEVGHINFAAELQRTLAATEAIYLMMAWAFAAGYRRFEWKCDALNRGSRRAAERYGLSFEGVFRQATVVKGRNRDTAWFAAIDSEWDAIREAHEAWLDPANFDAEGRQITRLSALTAPIRVTRDPLSED